MATGKKVTDRFYFYEELGRGAYGQVYRGMDSVSGDIVAIKQISLAGVPSDSLQTVMGEIELLKTLNHKNIVKYIGSFKSRTHLYIILEYMENGSLASVIKPNKYGTFSESLAAVYIAQVLQGLKYLHEQGVVHRDIKGANILTTKDVSLLYVACAGVCPVHVDGPDRDGRWVRGSLTYVSFARVFRVWLTVCCKSVSTHILNLTESGFCFAICV